jgi:hypothetical protein
MYSDTMIIAVFAGEGNFGVVSVSVECGSPPSAADIKTSALSVADGSTCIWLAVFSLVGLSRLTAESVASLWYFAFARFDGHEKFSTSLPGRFEAIEFSRLRSVPELPIFNAIFEPPEVLLHGNVFF